MSAAAATAHTGALRASDEGAIDEADDGRQNKEERIDRFVQKSAARQARDREVPAADRRFSPPLTAHDERATRKRGARWTGGARFGSPNSFGRAVMQPVLNQAGRPRRGGAKKNCAHYTRQAPSKTLRKSAFSR
jgi:hypothetical protein